MNETIELKSGQQGYVEYKSSNPFEFYHILNELDEAPKIDAQGWLIFPEKGKGPFPVTFCVHGSDNWAGHHHEHILNFLEEKYKPEINTPISYNDVMNELKKKCKKD